MYAWAYVCAAFWLERRSYFMHLTSIKCVVWLTPDWLLLFGGRRDCPKGACIVSVWQNGRSHRWKFQNVEETQNANIMLEITHIISIFSFAPVCAPVPLSLYFSIEPVSFLYIGLCSFVVSLSLQPQFSTASIEQEPHSSTCISFGVCVCLKHSCRKWHASKRYLNESTKPPSPPPTVNLRMLSIRNTLNAKIFLFVALTLSCLCFFFRFVVPLDRVGDRTFLLLWAKKKTMSIEHMWMLWITRVSSQSTLK